MGVPFGGVPFGVGRSVGSSGKPSSPTVIKRYPLRGRPAALGVAVIALGVVFLCYVCPLPPRMPQPTRSSGTTCTYDTEERCSRKINPIPSNGRFGFISDVVLWLLDAHRGKRGQKAGGRGEGRKIGLMSDFCQIEASKSQCCNFFENFSAVLFGGNGSLLYFCTRNRDARLSCLLRYALPKGGRYGRNDCKCSLKELHNRL